MRVEKLSRIWQHCDALGVSATLCGAKDERRAFHDREKAGEVSLGGKGEGRHPREARREAQRTTETVSARGEQIGSRDIAEKG